jgi:DNA-binding IclR family transcriptional regulator
VREYAARGKLVAHTRNTITTLAALEKELERVRKAGYALDSEEAEIGVKCIGAGIRDDTGALVAGLSISTPAERLKPQWAALVKDTADRISRSIGYRGQLAA